MPLVAFVVFQRGYVPILRAQRALSIIAAAGAGDASDARRRPVSLALLARGDAWWRLGDPSTGEDEAVASVLRAGQAVSRSMEAVPPPGARAERYAPRDPRGNSVMKPFRFGVTFGRVMESTNFGNSTHLPTVWWLNWPWLGTIPRQRQMGSPPMIVSKVTHQEAL